MNAPQQRDLFSRRWRKVRVYDPLEFQMQIALLQHVRLRARPDVLYWHTPNGELRDKRAAAKLKAMGVLPGVADLIFIWSGPAGPLVLFLELKARGRTMTAEQKVFAETVIALRCFYECVDNLDAAIALLKDYNLLKF